MTTSQVQTLGLALPKGRMFDGVRAMLAQAGIRVTLGAREYRPTLSMSGLACKLLKPQSIVEMLAAGSRDLGFAGADWVAELDVDLAEVLDTELDPVRVVAAAPADLLEPDGTIRQPTGRALVVATEYVRLTEAWIARTGLRARVVRSFGATEVFPPEDADLIVDNTATGATLAANKLVIFDELLRSSTRLYASRPAIEDPARAARIAELELLLSSVIEARRRVLIELNVSAAQLDDVVAVLPCMREPTVARLHGAAGFAVRAAVPRAALARIIPILKATGGADIVVSAPTQIVP